MMNKMLFFVCRQQIVLRFTGLQCCDIIKKDSLKEGAQMAAERMQSKRVNVSVKEI